MENRRLSRNYFPEPKFQFRFLRFLLLGSVVQILATCAVLHYFLRQNYVLLVEYAGLDSEVRAILFRELRYLVAAIGATFVVYLAAVAVLGVLFSHKIAGAIYALKRTIKEINEGKDSVLKLRQGDEFKELADNFNQMVANLKQTAKGSKSVNVAS